MKAKQGYTAPDELIADTSFGIIEGFFILSFIILGILAGGSLFVGFSYGYVFFKIFGFILTIILIIDISVYRTVKRFVTKISKQVTSKAREKINDYRVVDVDATDVK
jgi:hypothetical protein